MKYGIEINFTDLNDGLIVGNGTIFIENGKIDTSVIEEEFYAMLRKNEKTWLKEAEESEREFILNHLTDEQEEKLKEIHAEDYMGTDDDMPDSFDDYLVDIDLADLKEILSL